MSKINFVKSSRKEWKCSKCGETIQKGSSYYNASMFYGPTIIRCTKCGLKSWETSSSDYVRSVAPIVEDWEESYGLDESTAESIASDLESIRDDCQDRLDNIPEQLQEGSAGELLQERIDALDEAISELESIDWDSISDDKLEEAKNDLEDGEELDESTIQEEVEEEVTSLIDDALSSIEY